MPQPSKAPPEGHPFDTGQAINLIDNTEPAATAAIGKAKDSAAGPLTLSPALLQKLEAKLPILDSVRSLQELHAVPQTRMARQILCLELNVEAASAQLLQAYRKAAWRELSMDAPSQDATRRNFSAVSDDFRLTGSIAQGGFKDCEKSKGFTRASLSFHENRTAETPIRVLPRSKVGTPASLVVPAKTMQTEREAVVAPAR